MQRHALVVSVKEIYGWLLMGSACDATRHNRQLQPCAPLGLLPEMEHHQGRFFRHNVRVLEKTDGQTSIS